MTQEEKDRVLVQAVWKNNAESALRALKFGADPNSDIRGTKPLKFACWSGYGEVAEILLEAGADVNIKDNYGQTPLMLTAIHGDIKMIERLIKHGADINAIDIYGDTPLIYAAYNGKTDVMEKLLERGANTEICNNDGYKALDILKKEYPITHNKWVRKTRIRQLLEKALKHQL